MWPGNEMLFKWIILECLCGKLRVKISNDTGAEGGVPLERSPEQICDAILNQAHDDLDDAIQTAQMYLDGITPLRHLLSEITFMEWFGDE